LASVIVNILPDEALNNDTHHTSIGAFICILLSLWRAFVSRNVYIVHWYKNRYSLTHVIHLSLSHFWNI